jgi:hypothetical protein
LQIQSSVISNYKPSCLLILILLLLRHQYIAKSLQIRLFLSVFGVNPKHIKMGARKLQWDKTQLLKFHLIAVGYLN